jgi:hypothetical protein
MNVIGYRYDMMDGRRRIKEMVKKIKDLEDIV